MSEKIMFYLLEGCMYTQLVYNLLNDFKFYKNIINVNINDKDSYKITNNYNSFPQIFYFKNNVKYLIGGYNEFNLLCNFKYNKKNLNNDILTLQRELDLDKKIIYRILIYMNKIKN